MSSKHSRDDDGQGETHGAGGERPTASHRSTPGPDEPEIGFENREDYKPGPKRPVFFVFRRTVREFLADGGTDLAPALTCYPVLSLFPARFALMALVGSFGQTQESIDATLEVLAPLVSSATLADRIEPLLIELASMQDVGITLVLGLLG